MSRLVLRQRKGVVRTLQLINIMDGSKRRKLGSRVNEKTGSGIGIDTRFITFFFLNGRSTNVSIFIENLPQKKKKKRSIHNDFSYQKYINGSMATQREKTHIQYSNMYKLYVS